MSAAALNAPSPIGTQLRRVFGSAMVSGFLLVVMLTIVSKVVSFAKDAVIAANFGTASELDAFMLVFGFFSFAANILASGIPESFLPAYAELRERRGVRHADMLGVQCGTLHLAVVAIIGLILIVGAPALVRWTAHGFSLVNQQLSIELLYGLLPFLLCFGFSYHLSAWLRAEKSYLLPVLAQMFIPLGMIVAIWMAGEGLTTSTLVRGTVWGSVMQVLVLLIQPIRRLSHSQRWWRLVVSRRLPGTGLVARNALPFLLSGAVFSSAVVVDQTMAAWLTAGSVAVLGYSDKICAIVLGLTAAPATDVLFPHFANLVAKRNWNELRKRLIVISALIVAVALPFTVLLCLQAPWLIHTLFERRSFNAHDTQRVAEVLRIAAFQIPFYIVGAVTARVVVSLQASRLMLIISVSALLLNILFNWLLMGSLGVAGIALSTVIVYILCAITNCIACFILIRRKEAESHA